MFRKKIFIFILIYFISFTVFAKTGVMTGEEDIKVVKTQWFDIIYPSRCELSAAILYENADTVYEEIADYYGYPIPCRMPVVITPAVEIDNAYYSSAYYNHIVIYDTAVVEDLNVFSNTLLSTFKHELVHAYTYNLKNGFWKFISFFSDAASLSVLTVSPGMAEGATVSTESATGEGRMNDENSLRIIKQAKLEDDFPFYADVRGARDVYPYGNYYYFTGAFHKWLQEKYGMKKYGKYWYLCINNSLSNNMAFKKAYHISYERAWNQFEEDFPIPDIPANPVKAGEVEDFFETRKSDYSALNNSGARYNNLCNTEFGLFYTDASCASIYFIQKDNLVDKKIHPRKIFSTRGLYAVSFSKDGKYFIVTVDDENTATQKLRNTLYSFDGKSAKKIYEFSETGYFCNSILQNDGKNYLFANRYESSKYTLTATEILINNDKAQLGNVIFAKEFPVYVYASDYVQYENDKFAYIKKDKLDYSICICDFNGNLIDEVSISEKKTGCKNF